MNLSLLMRREERKGVAILCCVCQHTASPGERVRQLGTKAVFNIFEPLTQVEFRELQYEA